MSHDLIFYVDLPEHSESFVRVWSINNISLKKPETQTCSMDFNALIYKWMQHVLGNLTG